MSLTAFGRHTYPGKCDGTTGTQQAAVTINPGGRNRRSVWTIATQPYSEAHFATFPPALVEPCVLAGSRPGDTILDPFNGAGTTGMVALQLGRDYIGIELNPEYVEMTRKRLAPLLAQPDFVNTLAQE
ncbi:site-specific DNA-methyltransferase [bacterium]|nr:site-specific DNA-methyltransferase [bacterium]